MQSLNEKGQLRVVDFAYLTTITGALIAVIVFFDLETVCPASERLQWNKDKHENLEVVISKADKCLNQIAFRIRSGDILLTCVSLNVLLTSYILLVSVRFPESTVPGLLYSTQLVIYVVGILYGLMMHFCP